MTGPATNTSPALDILVAGDLHYVKEADHRFLIPERKTGLGPVLLRKALQRLRRLDIEVDLVVLLGDMVDNGMAPGADTDLAAVAAEVHALEIPTLAVPGNHDADHAAFARAFGVGPGLHEVGGYGFLVFHDPAGQDGVVTRSADQLALPAQIAAARPGLPLVALQHNPLHPQIESSYPYMPTNTAEILAGYNEAGVSCSLSSHYHPGQPMERLGGLTTYTVPALSEEPFRFAHVRLRGNRAEVHEHHLRLPGPELVDVHCHTEYAYCGRDVTATRNIELAQAMNVHRLCLTEHTFQLYFEPDEAWSWRWQTEPGLAERAWEAGGGRMPAYRAHVGRLRNNFVRLGLELDVRDDGSLLLADSDREGWDLLIGAVHTLPGFDGSGATAQAEAERLFLRDTERLVEHPIQVLAHPFRFFYRGGLSRPVHLYDKVAGWLAQRGVAAELNFHCNEPDIRFVEACLSHGVKLALGSDSHDQAEVGALAPHLALLEQVGVGAQQRPDVLYAGPP